MSILSKRTFAASVATGLILMLSAAAPAANIIHEFYVPLPEAQVKTALVSIEPASGIVGNTIESVISIVATGVGTVVHYDQWEDGYEVDLNNPTQPTTQIWGDGNDANGIPPGYAHDPASFSAGSVIVLRNQIPLPRNPANLFYDGRDRFGGTKALVVSRASWATTPGTVLCGANEILATMDYGTQYVAPIGDDVSASSMFEFVGLFVMARDDNTSVTIDPDGPGSTVATTVTLNRGESYLVNGAIKKGATVNATKPVQAHLITGDIGARYESRRFTLYPRDQWNSATYSPVGTAANGDQSYAFLYNPNGSAITINVTTCLGSSSFSVGANAVYQYQLPQNCGSKFVSAGGQQFAGVVTVGASPSANNVHDWGFSLVPSDNLTSEAVVGWGPGSSDLTQNGSPVWVTPIAATRVYVDYNGDHAGSLTDPNGGKYDAHYDLSALQTQTLYDPDKDQTAMRLYTADGTQITAAWGQDPAVAGPSNPFLDCGTTVLPFPVPVLKKTVGIITDTTPAGYSLNDVIEYSVTVDNHGLLPLGNVIVVDPLNASLSYVAGSTKRDGVAIPDDGSGTPFPLDGAGYTIPIITRGGTTTFTYRCAIVGTGTITNTVNNVTYNLSADTDVVVQPPAGSTQCGVQFTNATGTVVSSYSPGTPVYATLTDNDANTSSTTVQTISVVINDTTSGDAEFILLTETGVNTGIFRNTAGLATSLSAGGSVADGTMHVSAGDNLSFSYVDPQYADTCSGSATISTPTQNKFLYLNTDGADNDATGALDRVDPVATSDATTSSTSVLALPAGGTITAGTTTTATNTGLSVTFNHTVNTGTDRLLVVTIGLGTATANPGTPGTISSVTFAGTAMTQLGTAYSGDGARAYIYVLKDNPGTSYTMPTTGAIVVTTSQADSRVVAGATTFTNVDQTTSYGTVGSATSTGGTAISVGATSAVNELVLALTAIDEGGTNQAVTTTTTGSQVELWNQGGNNFVTGAASTKPGAAGTVTSAFTAAPSSDWAALAVSLKPAPATGGNTTATFTQSPAFASTFTLPSGATPGVTAYYTVSTGSMPASPSITAALRKNGTTFATSTSASASGGLLTFNFGALGSAQSFAPSDVMSLVVTTAQSGVSFTVDFDSTTKPSKITLPTTTVINISSLGVYDAAYPGGSLITSPTPGSTVYVRAVVNDPFGYYDISSLGLNIDGPGSSADVTTTLTSSAAASGATKTFDYSWTVGSTTGVYNIITTANEGTEGITDTKSTQVVVTQLDLGTPSTTEFTTGLNGSGTPVYAGNEQVCVRVTDLDQNLSSTTIETVTATITAASGDSELVTLTETGANTGIFAYCIPASTTTGSTHNDGTLKAVLGEVLTVVYVDPTDATDTSNDTATIPNIAPAISVNKTLLTPADGIAVIGESISYQVQVTNTGNTTLSTIALTDTYPAAKLTYVSSSLAPNTVASGSLTWSNVGPLTQGQSVTLTLNFTALATAAPATNTASANAGGGVTGSDTADVTITNPHVTITKTRTSAATANIGDNVTFQIVATNDGSSAIASLPIEDTFSGANFDFVSATPSPDSTGSGSLLWLDVTGAGNLAAGNSVTINVTLKAKGAAAPATNLAVGDYTVDVNGDPAPSSQSSATVTLVAAKITGTVYNDLNNNGAFNAGETGIESVTVKLYTDPNGDGDPADGTLVAIATTDVNGAYEFPNLSAQKYVVVESDPAGFGSSGDTQGANDNRIALNVNTLTTWSGNNFFDHLPTPADYAYINGKVINDANANGVNNSEAGLANIAVDLVQDTNGNGVADPGEAVYLSTLTDTSGNYSFNALPAGNYVIVEHDSFGWISTADTSGANNNQIPVAATIGNTYSNNDFLDTQLGDITGTVFQDANGNGSYDAGDTLLANIDVLITDSMGNTQTVSTNASGVWTASVPPGTTTVDVQQTDSDFTAVFSSGYTQTAGTDPSTVVAVSGTSTSAGIDGFRQIATVTGHLYVDTNGNGTQDSGEPDMPNVNVVITDVDGATQTVVTDSSGNWTATVPPGAGNANVDESDPDFIALVLSGYVHTQGNDPTAFTAIANTSVSGGIDGYYNPATVSGHLYIDTNGNGTQDSGEPDLANVDVLITDSNGSTQTVSTNASGNYTATVPPGSTTANVDEADPQFPAGAVQTQGTDPATVTAIAHTTVGASPNGYFIPATVTGHLYIDTNGNGTQDSGEPNLANVDVVITDSNSNTQTVSTNASGNWTVSVPPGSTTADVDETDPQFPAGSQHTEGTDPTTVTAVANSSVSAGNDGYFIPATITGHLYIDTNGNGTQDSGEPDLANIDVLITDSLSNTQTVSTNVSGNWTASVPPGSTIADVQQSDPDFPAGSVQTQGNDPTTFTAVAGASTDGGTDGFYIPATITGHLYIDTNGNGTQDSGEPNLANVDVLITDSNNNTQTVTTNASGNYTASVPPGSTTVNVDEADPQFPAGATQTEGTDPHTITAVANATTSAGNDGYFIPATITGHLYVDTNGNGTQDSGEPDLANVDVIITDSNGATQTVSTNASGDWSASVPPGTTVAEINHADPQFPAGAVQTQGDEPTTFTAVAGASTNGGIDGFFIPATVTGHLYIDTNGNGTQDSGEPDLANVDVVITDSNGATQTVSTNASGVWTASVPPGSTTANVDESDPQFPVGAVQTEGTDPKTLSAVANNSTSFGNNGYVIHGIVHGHLYIDTNGNGTQDVGEPNLSGVDVIVTDVNNVTHTVSTGADGNWSLAVPPGSTTANVDESDPQFPAGSQHTEGTDPSTVTAVANSSVDAGINGYYIPTSVTGHLYVDTNGNGTQDVGEPDLANVDVIVTDVLGHTQTVSSDSSGNWIASVPPGSTTADVDETDPQFPAGSQHTEGIDPNTVTAIVGSVVSAGINGYYIPATITGHLYIDTNGNGVQDSGEPNLANVDVLITDSSNNTQTVTTNASGNWAASVPPGSTIADVQQSDPDFPAGTTQTQGDDPTTFAAVAGVSTSGGIDGFFIPATITGHLFIDTNGNGAQDSGEPDLASVDVLIGDSNGQTQIVATDASGNWTATVPPGLTTVDVDQADPQFPAGATQTAGADPSTVTAVAHASTDAGVDGWFIPATITGHLYIDTNGNGTQDSGEPDLANVDVLVTDSNGATQTVSSDSSGNYTASVPPGSTVVDVQQSDPQFPAGSVQTEGTDPTTIIAVANTSTSAGNDGFYIPATITGHLYLDTNGNGVQDSGEPDLANVDVVITDSNGATQTVATSSNGNWTASVPPGAGSADVDETDADFLALVLAGYVHTQGDDPTAFTAVANSTVTAGTDGYYNPATITGHLYIDTNGNGTQDSGEPDLANIDVLITDSLNNTQTVSTNASGNWTASVPPGSTIADVQQSDPDFPVGSVQTQGDDPTTFTAVAGASTNGGIDGFFIPATVTGHLYIDTNGNGTQDSGEPNLANVDVVITDSNSNTQTVSTNASGNWTVSVPPGSTSADVDETDPQFPAGSLHTEGTDPTTVTAVANSSVSAGNDGYFIPASITGHLYIDTNGNGHQDLGEPDLANIDVIITDSNGATQTVSTNASGVWTASVPPGVTMVNVDDADPQFPAGAAQSEGLDPSSFTAVAGTSTDGGTDGYFIPATITGHLYIDTNGNGHQDLGEPDLVNVDVSITDSNNAVVLVATNALGNWTASVPPGLASVDVDELDPDFFSLVLAGFIQTEGLDPSSVIALANASTSAGNDGYYNPVTVTGHLYVDTNGNGQQDSGEPNLHDVTVKVTDSNNVVHEAVTDSDGNWVADVPPGNTSADVDEADADFIAQVPTGYVQTEGDDPTSITAATGSINDGGTDGFYVPATIHGHLYVDTNGNGTQDSGEPDLAGVDVIVTDSNSDTQTVSTNSSGNWSAVVPPGLASAKVDELDPQFVAALPSYQQTEGDDPTQVLAVAGADTDFHNDGYVVPALLHGHVYIDYNGNGTHDLGEPVLSNVTVRIVDINNVTHTTQTDSNGDWTASVPPGLATVTVDETDIDFTANVPGAYTETDGTNPSTVTAVANADTFAGNDGYFIPGTLHGHLYLDTNGNGTQDSGEPGIPDVDVVVTDAGLVPHVVATDANGNWSIQIAPGSASAKVQTSDPQFPAGVVQSEGTDPTVSTVIINSTVDGGTDGYKPLPGTHSISGQVRDDFDGDGNFSDNDTPVSGVVMKLWLDVNGNGEIDGSDAFLGQTVTNSNGQYTFGNLSDGHYLIQEVDPRPSISTADVQGDLHDNLVSVTIAGANVVARDFLDAVDPHGYIYDSVTGAIIPGGSVTVTTLNGGAINVLMNGATGQYSFLTDGTPGTYTIAVTPPPGYRIDPARPAQPGSFDPTGLGDPHSMGSPEDGGNPGYLVDHSAGANTYYLSFDLTAGDPIIINNNIPVVLIKPDTYLYWKSVIPGAGGTPGSNTDCDGYNDLLEYALCGNPATGVQAQLLFNVVLNGSSGHFDATFKRPAGVGDVTYDVQVIGDLVNSPAGWVSSGITPVITSNGDGSETLTFASVDTAAPIASLPAGFVRLKVTQTVSPNASASTETFGWSHRDVPSYCETVSNPFLKGTIFTGCVDGVSLNALGVATSAGTISVKAQMISGQQYFVEVVSGDNEGHRWEVDESASTANSIVIDTASPLNTQAGVPASLAGDEVTIRAHWTLGELFPIDAFTADSSAVTADRLLFYDQVTQGFPIYWLRASPAPSTWVLAGPPPAQNGAGRIVDNGEGLYVHPRHNAVSLLFNGWVRQNAFVRPLVKGYNFVGGGWPITQSPLDRLMTTGNGFTGSRDPLVADKLQFWANDYSAAGTGYISHFLLLSTTRNQWTLEGNAAVANENALPLFRSLRAVLLQSNQPNPGYKMPRAWTP